GVVWALRKLAHFVRNTRAGHVIVLIDHAPVVGISKQSDITRTVSLNKLNLKLVRTSQFIDTLLVTIIYKAGKSNIVPDGLSRLSITNDSPYLSNAELNALFTRIEAY